MHHNAVNTIVNYELQIQYLLLKFVDKFANLVSKGLKINIKYTLTISCYEYFIRNSGIII
jgi:hypothetical protein